MEIYCQRTLLVIFMIAISVSKIVIDHSDWETMGHYNILKTNIDYFSQSKISTL